MHSPRALLFQSTRPRGRTRPNPMVVTPVEFVSIHASSREDATVHVLRIHGTIHVSIHASSREDATRRIIMANSTKGFNPRVLAGGRDLAGMMSYATDKFQSTRPRGRTRLKCASLMLRVPWFQSTRPRGRTRLCVQIIFNFQNVSIHASSREDATSDRRFRSRNFTFQSTRPRGRTRL